MIDLFKIESEIDEILMNETEDSLKEWLKNQSKGNVFSYLGEGTCINLGVCKFEVLHGLATRNNLRKEDDVVDSPYTMAA